MQAGFRRKRDIALARECRSRSSSSAAGQRANRGALSTASQGPNNCAEGGTAATANQSSLAAALSGLLKLRGLDGNPLAVKGQAIQRECQQRSTLQSAGG